MHNHTTKFLPLMLACVFAISLPLIAFPAMAEATFAQWIEDFYPTAAENGIQRSIYDDAFAGITQPDLEVLIKAQYQPEFTTEIWDYLDARVNQQTIGNGREMMSRHAGTLAAIERRFGVERSIVLAIWSMESSYGKIFDSPQRLHYVPLALATLAYGDKKREKFARSQLIAALKIVQNGDITTRQLTGSWAGAMGHTQFIPTSYLAYAIDMDDNGSRDIWNSIPDALGTAANLLHENGWRTGKTWGYEVRVPQGGGKFEGQTRTLAQWASLGFARPKGKRFPRPDDKAVLKIPAGVDGPAFLMLRNFFILKRYNNSDAYALAVGLLADRLAGYNGLIQHWPRPAGALTIDEKFELQKLLQKGGYYTGKIDGNIGTGTRSAIRSYQEKNGLPPDGKPSQNILTRLRR